EFYAVHSDKPFFEDLVNYITSGPIVVQILEGQDAITKNRKIMGSTNPEEAEEGTIRKKFALSVEANSVHGSDSHETAKSEIKFFFDHSEITPIDSEGL
ncbi:MAG: nucleoside-diphosphate kinase, partial [Pseudomonadota bacterium]|nr:nucleoside-diphosphate kinase [Pseudomonadota bacterium]